MEPLRDTGPLIDTAACTGCGLCAGVCPSRALGVEGEKARFAGGCIGCGHCAAVCPAGAVTPPDGDGWAEAFASFAPSGAVIRPGGVSPGALVDLLRSRRSCRRYAARGVSGAVLEDLVRAAVTAPSGTNSQAWTFTVLTSRAAVLALGEGVAEFFRRLNRLAGNAFLRRILGFFGRKELEAYFREHYAGVRAALDEWDRDGTDRLFHGATAAILIGSRPGASCPAEDALLAAQNMLLTAHAMGLGTCLVGYAVEALRRDSRVRAAAGVPDDEPVHAVVALGWPEVSFLRQTTRRRPVVRYKTA